MLYVHSTLQDHISRFAKRLTEELPKVTDVIIRINNTFHNKSANEEGNGNPYYSTLSLKNTSYRKAIFCKVKGNGQIDTDWCKVNPNKPEFISQHFDKVKTKTYQNQNEMIEDIQEMIDFLLQGKHNKEDREKIKIVSSRQNLTNDVVYGSEIYVTFESKGERIFILTNGDKIIKPLDKVPKVKNIHPGFYYVENNLGDCDVVNKTKLKCLYTT